MDSIFPSAAPSILVAEDDADVRSRITLPLTKAFGAVLAARAAGAGSARQPRPENLTAARIKPASSCVHLS
jgi:hypothetical protein